VNRDRIVEALRAENIGAGMHYRAIHLHPYYRELFREWSFPVASQVSEATLTLPLSPKLSRGEMESIARGLERVLNFFAL
jgi:dTDP-4-amino-4,6-dideoxygalactose transaminase